MPRPRIQIREKLKKACEKFNITLLTNVKILYRYKDKGERQWTPLKFRCNKCNHTYTTSTPNLYKEHGVNCPRCKKTAIKSNRLSVANKVAKKHKAKCIEEIQECKGYDTRIKFKCSKGHVYYKSIEAHQRQSISPVKCPSCRKIITFKKFITFLKEHKISCFTKEEEYKDVNHKLKLKCNHGHTWESSINITSRNFERSGTVCIQCNRIKEFDKYSDREHRITLISNDYIGYNNYMDWKCHKCKKIFRASAKDMWSRKFKCPTELEEYNKTRKILYK